MRKSFVLATVLAMAISIMPNMSSEAFGLGDLVKKVQPKKAQPVSTSPAMSSESASIKHGAIVFTGRIVRPDGSPATKADINFLVGPDLRFAEQPTRWIVESKTGGVGAGSVNNQTGRFECTVHSSEPMDFVFHSLKGSTPLVIRDVVGPVDLGDLTIHPGPITEIFTGYVP